MPKFVWGSGLNSFFYLYPRVWFPSHWQEECQNPNWMAERQIIKSNQGFLMRTKENRKDVPSVAIVFWAHVFLHPHRESSKKTQHMFLLKLKEAFFFWEKRAQCGYLNTPPITGEWHFCQIHTRHLWESFPQQLRGKITSTWIYLLILVKLNSHIYELEWAFGKVGTKISSMRKV